VVTGGEVGHLLFRHWGAAVGGVSIVQAAAVEGVAAIVQGVAAIVQGVAAIVQGVAAIVQAAAGVSVVQAAATAAAGVSVVQAAAAAAGVSVVLVVGVAVVLVVGVAVVLVGVGGVPVVFVLVAVIPRFHDSELYSKCKNKNYKLKRERPLNSIILSENFNSPDENLRSIGRHSELHARESDGELGRE
jgi:hypothetical protein